MSFAFTCTSDSPGATITRDGVVAVFQNVKSSGAYADGSVWLEAGFGGVRLTSVSIDVAEVANLYVGGVMVDPQNMQVHGFDNRSEITTGLGPVGAYDASVAQTLPLTVDHYPDGSPKTIWLYRGLDAVPAGGAYSGCWAMVEITVVSTAKSSAHIKPTGLYVAGGKPEYTTSDINYSVFTPVAIPGGAGTEPDWDTLVGNNWYFKRPLVQWGRPFKGSAISPSMYQDAYPGNNGWKYSQMLLAAVSTSTHRVDLINRIVRDGLMIHSQVALGSAIWAAGGGFGASCGRFIRMFAGKFLNVPAMLTDAGTVTDASYSITGMEFFQEDDNGCIYTGVNRVLYGTKGHLSWPTPPFVANHDLRDPAGLVEPHEFIYVSGTAQSAGNNWIRLASGTSLSIGAFDRVYLTGGTGSGVTEAQKLKYFTNGVLKFDAGTAAITAGQTVRGATSGVTAVALEAAVVLSGTYGGSNAAGFLIIGPRTANGSITNFTDNELLQVSSVTKSTANGVASEYDSTYKVGAIDSVWTVNPDATTTYNIFNGGGYQVIASQRVSGASAAVVLAKLTDDWACDNWLTYIYRYVETDNGLLTPRYPTNTVFQDATARIRRHFDTTPWTEAFWNVAAPTWMPTLSAPVGTKTGTTTATIGATTNIANGTMYGVCTSSATKPTAAQIKAGKDHTGTTVQSGTVAVATTGAKTISITGLTASTVYFAHVMHESTANAKSIPVSSSSFITDGAAVTFTQVTFDGTADYLSRGANIGGFVDGEEFTFVCRCRIGSTGAGTFRYFVHDNTDTFKIAFNTADQFQCYMYDGANGRIVFQTTTSFTNADGMVTIFIAGRSTSGSEVLQVYKDGTAASFSIYTHVPGPMDLTFADWKLFVAASLTAKLDAVVEFVWFDNIYYDVSNSTIRDKWLAANIGANGAGPGAQPKVFIYGAASVWNAGTNAGTGGNFTMTGAVT